ncbi:4Fe-4S dicluster domain-containing protein [bacterium]|nr:4Fe-4S dicluster domain-containing protein [bacterium]
MKQMSILTDITRCIGCEKCVMACKELNETGPDRFWPWQRSLTDLSASRWTTLIRKTGNRYVRQQCRHCLEPACVSACLVGALTLTSEGAVVYDPKVCMGCRYCMMACPYAIPRYSWADPVPYIHKCTLCHEQIMNGSIKEPACTRACPTQATIFGDREALLNEAHRRLKEQPERYPFQQVWGEHEIGGTSVLYLSDMDLSFLNWKPDLGTTPLPLKTWTTLKTVPYTFVAVGAAMFGIHKLIERRMELQAQNETPSCPVQEASTNEGPPKPGLSGTDETTGLSTRADLGSERNGRSPNL